MRYFSEKKVYFYQWTTQGQEKDSYSPDYVSYQYELTEQVGSLLLKWDQQLKQKHYAFYANHPEKKNKEKNAKNTSKRQTPEVQTSDGDYLLKEKFLKEKHLKEKLLKKLPKEKLLKE